MAQNLLIPQCSGQVFDRQGKHMYTDEYLKKFLAGYGAKVPDDFFLLWDGKTEGYSVCYFNALKRPSVLFIDDEELSERTIRFLQDNGVKVTESIDDVIKK